MRFTLLILALISVHFGIAQTNYTDTIQHDGLDREFKVYVPASYSASTPVPLLFNLHGYTSNMTEQEWYADFRPIADTANFILIHPNGTLDQYNEMHWNAFGNSSVDDVGFLTALIDTISAQYNIDSNRVYSCGMSNGGFMSYVLACDISHKITAVASVTGGMVYNKMSNCSPDHPMPIMQIHGTGDNTVPYNGSATICAVDSLVRYWAWFNNCNMTPSITNVPNIDPNDMSTATHYVYSGGTNNANAELFRIDNGGHTWPGAPINIGVTNQDIDASVEIWKFFSRYQMSEITAISKSTENFAFFKLFPNPSSGSVTILFETTGDHQIVVRDIAGRVVQQMSVTGTSSTIEIDTQGTYLVEVISEDRRGVEVVVIEE